VKQAWNGRAFGGPLVFEGTVMALDDDGTTLTFRVQEGTVIRTFTMSKADARIRVSAEGITLTDTEAQSHA
jgi:hypothetical protein